MSTIAAIATPPGKGAIAIVRLSGPDAKALLSRVFLPLSEKFENFVPRHLHRGRVLDWHGEAIDDVLAVYMPAPRTYTGEDIAEIQCHGSPLVAQAVLETMLRLGAEPAARGEFTRRAFLNGRMDLSQAEAVAELVAAPSREALRYGLNRLDGGLSRMVAALRDEIDALRCQLAVAVDFPEDEVEVFPRDAFESALAGIEEKIVRVLAGKRRGRLMQQGVTVVLAGAVNAGKSSLLNALLGRDRALVTDRPGTTRDFLEEYCEIEGLPVRLVDTAGLRAADAPCVDEIEALGIDRSREQVVGADAVLLVLDGARMGEAGLNACDCPDEATAEVLEHAGQVPVIIVWNKCDVCRPASLPFSWAGDAPCCSVSARTGENLDVLTGLLRRILLDEGSAPVEGGLVPNARQAIALEAALAELKALRQDIAGRAPSDCCSVRLDTLAAHLAEVAGLSSPSEVLDKIFSHFCIGK